MNLIPKRQDVPCEVTTHPWRSWIAGIALCAVGLFIARLAHHGLGKHDWSNGDIWRLVLGVTGTSFGLVLIAALFLFTRYAKREIDGRTRSIKVRSRVIAFGLLAVLGASQALVLCPRAASAAGFPFGLPDLLAIILILWGLFCLFRSTDWEFTPEEVRVRNNRLFHSEQWQAPLPSYRGVLADQRPREIWLTRVLLRERHSYNRHHYTLSTERKFRFRRVLEVFHLDIRTRDSSNRFRARKWVYDVILKHSSDAEKDIWLRSTNDPGQWRHEQERYARLFSLPALKKDEKGNVVARAVDDLDKSIAQRVREGTLQAALPATDPPGEALDVQVNEGAMRFSCRHKTAAQWRPALGFCFLLLALIGGMIAMFATDSVVLRGGWIMLELGAVGLGMVGLWTLAACTGHDVLELSSETVRRWREWFFGTLRHCVLSADQIEDVSQGPSRRFGNKVVRLIADERTIEFGEILDEEERGWVVECTKAVLAGALQRPASTVDASPGNAETGHA